MMKIYNKYFMKWRGETTCADISRNPYKQNNLSALMFSSYYNIR